MTPDQTTNLQLSPTDDGVASNWTTKTGDLHFHDHGFDDYGTEVITLAAEYEHRPDIKALDWSYSYPMVLPLPDGAEAGQRVVETIMTGLLRRGLSPGQAWAYYGVEIRGYSRNQWANRCGYSDHSAVSEPLRKAKKKLPA